MERGWVDFFSGLALLLSVSLTDLMEGCLFLDMMHLEK